MHIDVNKKPVVSIIIPTYNRESILNDAIQSALRQTYIDIEVIVVDDGSTDGTSIVLESIKDTRFKYIILDNNVGGAGARNIGFEASMGKYLIFLDSDDLLFTDYVEKQLKIIEQSKKCVGVVYSGAIFIDSEKKQRTQIREIEGDLSSKLIFKNCIGTLPGSIIRRECFEEAGKFDITLTSCQDWDLWIKISKKYKFKANKVPLVWINEGSTRITTNPLAKALGHQAILNKNFSLIKKNKKYCCKHHITIGHFFCLSGYMNKGRRYFIEAIKFNPKRMKCYIYFLCSLLPFNIYLKIRKRLSNNVNKNSLENSS